MARAEKLVVSLSSVDRALLRQIRDLLRDAKGDDPEAVETVHRLVEGGIAPKVHGVPTYSSQAGLASIRPDVTSVFRRVINPS